MKFKHSIKLLIFLFFFNNQLVGQIDTVYVNEHNKIITKSLFYKKVESDIFNGLQFKTDSVLLKKIRFNYFFGSLEKSTKTQIFKFLNKKHQIDTSKTMIIHYRDTLKSIGEFPKVSHHNYRPFSSVISCSPYFDETKSRSHKDFIISHQKCIKTHQKIDDNISVLHFYYHNNGHRNKFKNLTWYHDSNQLIKNIFTDEYKNYEWIIIHPDGEFYMKSGDDNISYEKIVRKQNWYKLKEDFLDECKLLNLENNN